MAASGNQTITKLAKRVKADPEDSFSKFALALEFLKTDELQRANILFENIHQHDPDYVGVYYHLGKLKERFNDLEKAQQLYQEGVVIAEKKHEKRTLKELEEALAAVNIELEAMQ